MSWLGEFSRNPKRDPQPFRTVAVECIVPEGKTSYRIGGKRQAPGDRGRLNLDDARYLEKLGRLRILPDSMVEKWR